MDTYTFEACGISWPERVVISPLSTHWGQQSARRRVGTADTRESRREHICRTLGDDATWKLQASHLFATAALLGGVQCVLRQRRPGHRCVLSTNSSISAKELVAAPT